MSLMFGVISWLPDNGGFNLNEAQRKEREEKNVHLRKTRKQMHLDQLIWTNENLPSSVIRMGVYQNWKPEEFEEKLQKDMIISRHDGGIGPSRARNEILGYFYNSNHDWLMMCDDDAWLYDYYNPKKFLKEIHTTKMFDDLGMIIPWHPTSAPFKKMNYNETTQQNYVFVRARLNLGVQVAFIPNIVKRSKATPVYFNVPFYDKFKYSEDTLFCHDWVTAGHPFYSCTTLVTKMNAFNNSSLLGLNSSDDRKMFAEPAKRALAENSNLELVKRGDKVILSTRNVYNVTPSIKMIPRKEPLEFSEIEIPKGSNKIARKNKLF